MERGEMPWHSWPKIFCEPFRRAMQLSIAVVLAGNDKRRDFEPDVCFVPEIFQRVEYRLKVGKTKPMIKRVGKRFQIDIRRVHVLIEFRARILGDVTRGDCDSFDPAFSTRIRDVNRVLGKNYGVIVSERDGATAKSFRCQRDLLRRRGIGELVPFACFGDVPVLTKPAAKVASGCAEGKHARSWKKMVQRLFFQSDRHNIRCFLRRWSARFYTPR